jgi:hypothetical protein
VGKLWAGIEMLLRAAPLELNYQPAEMKSTSSKFMSRERLIILVQRAERCLSGHINKFASEEVLS